jgi:outer membrane protein assembly factor BamB
MGHAYDRDFRTVFRILVMGILAGALAVLSSREIAGIINSQVETAITTYHYDNMRSGWNSRETQLNYSNVNVSSLGVQTVQLEDVNDQVDAQPLIVPNLQIAGGNHDVVYVSTESNNIYAFDANTGVRLSMVNLGPPVPKPQGCLTNGPTVGIEGTPVIDLQNRTMYVITYSLDPSRNPAYSIHALDLATLTEKAIQPITATQTLTDGTFFRFNAAWQRQQTGLLLANGNVYAGFGSVCDGGGPQSRGWIMGWHTPSLAPLAAAWLTNSQTSEPNGIFLSGVWMSGYGIAGDQNGHIYFSTGSSDPSGTNYDAETNASNSVVRLNPDLSRPPSPSKFVFTPANVAELDQKNLDMSAGGVMLLPSQPGPVPNMAVATAKDGRMFLLNRDNLGGFTPNDTGALNAVSIGNGCWCGPTYFNDGSPHIVSSGGGSLRGTLGPNPGTSQNVIGLWNLQTSPTPKLIANAYGNMPDTIQDPGFFTTVSSNGTSNAIIWAVSRPLANSENPFIWLYAFRATPAENRLPVLFESMAGNWPYVNVNANVVPVVANGKVYVVSYRELDIFGLNLPNAQKVKDREKGVTHFQGRDFVKGPEEHQVSGTVLKVDGSRLTIQTRDKKTVEVDATEAKRLYRYSAGIAAGRNVVAGGSYDAHRVLQAVFVFQAKPSPETWPPDH